MPLHASSAPPVKALGYAALKGVAPWMVTRLATVLTALVGLLGATPAQAEKGDRDKPMYISADSMRYDDLNQTSVWTGNVIVTKGTMTIRSDKLDVREDPDGYQYGVATGSPAKRAFYRQKRDNVDEFIEGEGETIFYDGKLDTVRFVVQAQTRRLRGATLSDEVNAGTILYENLTDRFSADGAGVPAAGGRVRAMLSPKPKPSNATSGPTSGLMPGLTPGSSSTEPSPTLRTSPKLPDASTPASTPAQPGAKP